MSSCKRKERMRIERAKEGVLGAHLERLRVPVLDLGDGRHVAEVVRKLVELLYSVGEAYREFLWEVRQTARNGRAVEDVPRRN